MPEYYEGYKAFMEGRLVNPYRLTNLKGKEWQHGFDHAYIDQQKRLGAYQDPGPKRPNRMLLVRTLKQQGFAVAAAHFEKHGLALVNASL